MKTNQDLRTLTRLALLVAIELVMKAVGLGSVPMGAAVHELFDPAYCGGRHHDGAYGRCCAGRRIWRSELL